MDFEKKLKKINKIAEKLIKITPEYDNCYYKNLCFLCRKECLYKLVNKIIKETNLTKVNK